MKNKNIIAQSLLFTILFIPAFFLWQGHVGFSLWDEGYLWYGAQRVLQGEVPIRDFKAYDPGRYYWSAAVLRMLGNDGIVALRVSVTLFQAIGLFIGLFLIGSTMKNRNFIYLILASFILMAWMYPRHKYFDISLSIMLIGIFAFLINNSSGRRYFLAGVVVGLAAVFGRNHGFYGIAGSIGVMVWLAIKRDENFFLFFIKGFWLWSAGIICGFMPILVMGIIMPDFATAFWQNICFLFERKTTNIPLPIPWPWCVDFLSVPVLESIRQVLIGLFFIGIVLFGFFAVAWIFFQRIQGKNVSPAFVAAAFMALPYSHHAHSRADIAHLAQGIFPLLIGLIILLSTQRPARKWLGAIALCLVSIWVMHVHHPAWQCRDRDRCVKVEISESSLWVRPGVAYDIELLRNLAKQFAPEGQSFIAAPFWPGAYALLERKSPMWEIYPLHPRSQEFEEAEIERIKQAEPAFAIIIDRPLDGSDDLRFRNTHPLTNQFIKNYFELLPDSPKPGYLIYKAKEN